MKKTTIGAIVVTVLWMAGVSVLVWLKWDTFLSMKPNELGDFFAGSVASPLALIWLVAGYMQQGEDLRLNTEALHLQQKELQEQVKATLQVATHAEQQAAASVAMVEASKAEAREREIEKIWEIQPNFQIAITGATINEETVYILKTSRGDARLVTIWSDSYFDHPDEIDIVTTNKTVHFSFYDLKPGKDRQKFRVSVRYSDVEGYIQEQRFMIKDNVVFNDGWDRIGDHRNEL